MKKLIILFGIVLISASVSAQRTFFEDSIPFPSSSDTTVYLMFYDVDPWSIQFDYSALNNTDGTLDLGGVDTNDGTVFDRLDDSRLPVTLSDSTVSFEKTHFPFRYIAIKFTPNSCTSGTIKYRITKR